MNMKGEKGKNMRNKGITLIALVITIIVLLILAAVSIATLTGENGILTRANDAKEQTEIADEKEAIQLAYAGAVAEKRGDGDVTASDLNNEFTTNGRTDANASGDNPITVTFDSGRTYTIDSNGNITGPEEANIIATMKIVGEKVTTDPPMPNDNFEHIEGTIDTGYVIRDKTKGNEFVWVPVDKNQRIEINVTSKEDITSITLTDPYGDQMTLPNSDNLGTSYSNTNVEPTINGPYVMKVTAGEETKEVILGVHSLYAVDTTADWFFTEEVAIAQGASSLEEFLRGFTLEEAYVEYAKMFEEYTESNDNDDINLNDKESVEANGGFYIGRYEASYEDGKAVSKKSTDTRTTSSTTLTDGMLWNWISQTDALQKSKEMYSGKGSLLTGAAWDRTLGWLEETGVVNSFEIVGDSKTWGNYRDDNFTNNDPTSLMNTGSMSQTEKNHIFDLAGNLEEWTTEANDSTDRVNRGGFYNNSGSFNPACLRIYYSPSYGSSNIGFRPALFL